MNTSVKRTPIALLAVILWLLAATAPASADFTEPTLGNVVYRTADASPAGDQVVRLELPTSGSWRIWKAAKAMDAEIDGLTISRGDCAALPTALCVKVAVGTYSAAEQEMLAQGVISRWSGLAVTTGNNSKVIYLNTGTTLREHRALTAAHELGHVLGLSHHDGVGLMSENPFRQTKTLSDDELALLRAWFAVPRFVAGE